MKKNKIILLAELSGFNLNKDEIDEISARIEELDSYVCSICDIDSGDEIFDFDITTVESLRDDIVKESLPQEDVLKNASKSKNGYIQFARRK